MLELQWAVVGEDMLVLATPSRAWLQPLTEADSRGPFAEVMSHPADLASTERLLEAVLHAARLRHPRYATPPLSRWQWLRRLSGYHRTTSATPGLLRAAAARFSEQGRERLARWALERAEEERGHDELALRDIAALEPDTEAVLRHFVPETSNALVTLFARVVQQDVDPVGCLGYAHALERLSLCRGSSYLARVEACLPAGVSATRCLRVHSALGSDADHVTDNLRLIATLNGEERTRVAQVCFETACLCYALPAAGVPTDAELEQRLVAARGAASVAERH